MENMEVKNLFNQVYEGKTVFITGHTGFKGSWLSFWLLQLGAKVIGFSLNNVSKPSHFELLQLQELETNYGDIRNKKILKKHLIAAKPDMVFHLAAQPLVRESYRNPIYTYETNVIGTLNLLEACKECGSVKALINVTTDKVYENSNASKPFSETDILGGRDLYSSSKACSEILTSSYKYSFFRNNNPLIATARSGNVIGGGDWANERLVPDIVKAAAHGKRAIIRNPASIRPWQHVLEPIAAYLLLGQMLLEGKKEFAESWNFGPAPEQSLPVIEVVDLLKKQWNKVKINMYNNPKERWVESEVLRLDCTKAKQKMKWNSIWDIETSLSRTIKWYKNYYETGKINTANDLQTFIKDAVKKKLIWTSGTITDEIH